jgi:hypothetical protein
MLFYMALEHIIYEYELAAFDNDVGERTHKIFKEWCRATVCARNLKESVYRAEKLEHDRDMAAIKAITPGQSDVVRGETHG